MKIIKGILIVLCVLLVLISPILFYVIDRHYGLKAGLSCGPCLQEQDYIILENLKQAIPNKGDVIKVSDFHPGDWLKVCTHSGGYNYNLAIYRSENGDEKYELDVINNADSWVYDDYSDQALYFYYGKSAEQIDSVEIYKMTTNLVRYFSSPSNQCFDQDGAYFYAEDVIDDFWSNKNVRKVKNGRWNDPEHLKILTGEQFFRIKLAGEIPDTGQGGLSAEKSLDKMNY